MLSASRFHYNAGRGSEEARGATSPAFAFGVIYVNKRCTLNVDGRQAKNHCIVRYINKLRRVRDTFSTHCAPEKLQLSAIGPGR